MKPMNFIPTEEEDALRRILAHHEVPVSSEIVKDLCALLKWVHETEQAKQSFSQRGAHPMPILSLLSTLGIYGGEAIGPSPRAVTT